MNTQTSEEPAPRLSALAQTLMQRAGELTQRVTAEIYQNPFWEDRYGARGRHHIEQDGKYHIEYLCQALQMGPRGEPEVLSKYGQWLRTVLVSRGMCSLHLSENFASLAAVLAREPIDGVEIAAAYLHEAAAALRYCDGPAKKLEEQSPELVERTTHRLCAAHPEWGSPCPQWKSFQAYCAQELRYWMSYLADAVASQRPELLARYLTWHKSFMERCSPDAVHAPRTLPMLAALQRELAAPPPAFDAVLEPVFATAHASLQTS